jgi:hypothetical protein
MAGAFSSEVDAGSREENASEEDRQLTELLREAGESR